MDKNSYPPSYDDSVKSNVPYSTLSVDGPPPIAVQPQMMPSAPVAPPLQQTIIVNTARAGGCPVCGQGVLKKEFTCCAICLAICLFPIGILCCLCIKHRVCNKCGATFN